MIWTYIYIQYKQGLLQWGLETSLMICEEHTYRHRDTQIAHTAAAMGHRHRGLRTLKKESINKRPSIRITSTTFLSHNSRQSNLLLLRDTPSPYQIAL